MGMIVFGNRKVSRKVALFDLPAKETCLNHSQCWRNCYAYREQHWYHLREIRAKRLWLTQQPDFVQNMITELQPATICRPHASGDFYSQEYLNKWIEIMRKCSKTRFYLFTKVKQILDFKEMDKLHNVNVISSILPDGETNFHHPLMLELLQNKYGYKICPATKRYSILEYDKGLCMGACQLCLTEKNMLFEQH